MFKWLKKYVRSDVRIDSDIEAALRAAQENGPPTTKKVYGIPAFRHVVDIASANIGFCSVDVLKDGPDESRENDKKHPAWKLLNRRANSYSSAYSVITGAAADSISVGNGIIVVAKALGVPFALYLVNPDAVEYIYNTSTGELFYKIGDEVFPEHEIIHVRGLTAANCVDGIPYGVVGRSAVNDLADTLGIRIAEKKYATSYFRNNGGAMLVITYPVGSREPSDDEKDKLRKKLDAIHKGSDNAHKVMQLFGGGTANRLPLAPLDFTGPKFGIVEVVSGLGFSAFSKFGSEINQSYSSQEWESKAFINDLNKILVPFEEQLSLKLLREDQQDEYAIEFRRSDLIELDEKTKSDILDNKYNNGRISFEEMRREDNRSTVRNPNETWRRPANIMVEGEEPAPNTAENTQLQPEKPAENAPENDPETTENETVIRSKTLVSATIDRLFERLSKDKNPHLGRHKEVFIRALPYCERSISGLWEELESVLPEQRNTVIEGYNRANLVEEVCKDLQIQ